MRAICPEKRRDQMCRKACGGKDKREKKVKWEEEREQDSIVSNYEQIDSHSAEMQKSEKRGYRTLSWVVMNYLTTKCKLDSSLGEPLFGSYPSLRVVHDRDEW
eukprot:1398207-Rhodomonas_salina.1